MTRQQCVQTVQGKREQQTERVVVPNAAPSLGGTPALIADDSGEVSIPSAESDGEGMPHNALATRPGQSGAVDKREAEVDDEEPPSMEDSSSQ